MKYRLQIGSERTTYNTYGDAVLAARLHYDGQMICHIDAMPDMAPFTVAAWWDMAAIIRAERAYADIEAETYGDDALAEEAALIAAWEDVERVNAHAENYETVAVESKAVRDSDGWWTDYTLYTEGGVRWWCVFGDPDIYGPDSDPDFETDDEAEAYEWFDAYDGLYDEDEDEDEDYTREPSEAEKRFVVATWTRGEDYSTDGRYYTWTDAADTVWELDGEECRIRHRGTGQGCFWTEWRTVI